MYMYINQMIHIVFNVINTKTQCKAIIIIHKS